MKKKAYLAPAIDITNIQIQSLLNNVSNVGGDAGITPREGEVPTTGDSRRRRNVWEDDDDDLF